MMVPKETNYSREDSGSAFGVVVVAVGLDVHETVEMRMNHNW